MIFEMVCNLYIPCVYSMCSPRAGLHAVLKKKSAVHSVALSEKKGVCIF